MPACSGIIEAISVKEMPQPDRFGNTHRANLKIGEDWFSYGAIKKPVINIKDGANWVELQKGMEVEFMYDQNGDFKNVKKQSFTITNKEGAQAPAPRQQSAPKQQSQGGSFVNPAEVGQCLNLAAEVLKLSGDDLVNPDKVVEAIQWYKRVRQLFNTLYPTVDVEETLKPKKKAAPKPKVEEEPPFDEDEYCDSMYDEDMPI